MRSLAQNAAIAEHERAKKIGPIPSMRISASAPAPMGPLKTAAMAHIKQPRASARPASPNRAYSIPSVPPVA